MPVMRKLPVVLFGRRCASLPEDPETPQRCRHPASSREGRIAIVTKRGKRETMDAAARETNALNADGEVVWS